MVGSAFPITSTNFVGKDITMQKTKSKKLPSPQRWKQSGYILPDNRGGVSVVTGVLKTVIFMISHF